MNKALFNWLVAASAFWLWGCDSDVRVTMGITQTGIIEADVLDEISGIQASQSDPGTFFVHNDGGQPRLYAIDEQGRDLGHVTLLGAENHDWEDIASIPGPGGPVLVIGDTGDNRAERDHLVLYLCAEPRPGTDGRYSGQSALLKQLSLRYPDGARDLEAMAFDPRGQRLLFLSKRDKPPRLYALGLEDVWTVSDATLKYLGPVNVFRPPEMADFARFGHSGSLVSQPTGMDISSDGTQAAVITFRSLYLFKIGDHGDWLSALLAKPVEIIGPPGGREEAISFTADGRAIYVTTEGRPAPLYRFRLISEEEK